MRAILIAVAVVLSAMATPALAQRNADEEDSMILGASTAMFEAYRRNDSFEGDEHCRALRDMLHSLRFHSNERYKGAMDMVERHCGEWDAPVPRSDTSAGSSSAASQVPRQMVMTSDQQNVWSFMDVADQLIADAMALPAGNNFRNAKLRDAIGKCDMRKTLYSRIDDAGALIGYCINYSKVASGDGSGCADLRANLVWLKRIVAEQGVFTNRAAYYITQAEPSAAGGVCAGATPPAPRPVQTAAPPMTPATPAPRPAPAVSNEQRISTGLDRAEALAEEIDALPAASTERFAKTLEMRNICNGLTVISIDVPGSGPVVGACQAFALLIAGENARACRLLGTVLPNFDKPATQASVFAERAGRYRNAATELLASTSCSAH